MKQKILPLILSGILLAGVASAASILQPTGGGTGIGSTAAGNLGKVLTVSTTTPVLKYTFTSPTATTTITDGSGTATGPGFTFTGAGGLAISCTGAGCTFTQGGATSTNYWTLSGLNLFPTSTSYLVGIGTTTPATPLSVVGGISGSTFLRLATSTIPPAEAGAVKLHAAAVGNIPRLEVDTLYTVNGCDIINRDNCVVASNADSAITIGQAVYVDNSSGALPTIKLARANAALTSPVLGLVASTTVPSNASTYVMTKGILSNVDTSAFTAGDILYLSPTVAGALTITRPTVPNYVTRIGTVLVSNVSTGSILVEVAPAVLGRETGTVSATFNINGANALTTSSIGSTVQPYLGSSFVSSTAAGTGISVSGSTGAVTITNIGVTSIVAGTAATVSNATGTVTINAKNYLAQGVFSYATSSTIWDDAIWIPRTTSTVSDVRCVNQAAGDTVTLNFYYGASRNTATSSAFKLFSSDQTITSTSTPTVLTINASSTPGLNQPLRMVASNASSTETTCSVYYQEN